MLHKVTRRVLPLAACGCLVSLDASALAVGRAQGAVLVGRPLELTVPVTLDGPAGDEPCVSAEVFYGEERVRRAPTARWEPGTGGQGVLRVVSPAPVDEPMVTVYLHVGCGQGTTRRFVLLSEPPPQNETAAPPRLPSVPAQPPMATRPVPAVPAAGVSVARAPRSGEAGVATLHAERGLRAARPEAGRPAAPASVVRSRLPEPTQGRPRLRLEPLDLAIETDPVLRLSTELRSQVAADPQRRAAAAALWQALQKDPDASLQDAQRLQSVQRELKSLRDATQQNAAAMVQMRAEVERVRAERGMAGAIVAGLSAILLALFGWLGWRWYGEHRLRQVGRWFEVHGDAHRGSAASGLATQATPAPQRLTPVPAGLDDALTAATAPRASAAVFPFPAREEFLASRGGLTRMVGVQELIDVHDKADFFLSIGEDEQAIALLEAHVHDDVETSALAWLDLLELYHSLGRRADYERLRNEFRERFTAQAPDFEHFEQRGASLEDYGRALGRILALWPAPEVLGVIEESIFRRPGLPGAESFSLEAYRELVLLYHIAQEVSQPAPAEEVPETTVHDTSVRPLELVARERPDVDLELLMVPPSSVRLGVDIDLDELPKARPVASELQPLDFDIDEPSITPPLDARHSRI
ncbi:hypothetical protein GCM10028796_02950 [Ramlibacter monticola]|uniref:Uncharacterized protein n=1 Tax=Ramlibacter monticola TaxID=1926872 RepID=A0A936YXZ4_9BURK|nr:hypothetical protein [Ramlibacter monticola]MBL0391418.1 hypothetical protein [Ramlibacter monticola]